MAEKTKSPSQDKPKTPAKGRGGINRKDYMLVRTALDSVQYNAIRYYVAGANGTGKEDRARAIARIMRDANAAIEALPVAIRSCDGSMCDGFCVPYQCPD